MVSTSHQFGYHSLSVNSCMSVYRKGRVRSNLNYITHNFFLPSDSVPRMLHNIAIFIELPFMVRVTTLTVVKTVQRRMAT
jgi:hypothetical protein